jgi:hypothetical protein
MKYGEYRSAREQAFISNNWREPLRILKQMPVGDERDAALRDWWINVDIDSLLKAGVQWMSAYDEVPTVEAARHVAWRWEIDQWHLMILSYRDMDLEQMSHRWCEEIIEEALVQYNADIALAAPQVFDLIAQYRLAIKTEPRSKEMLACKQALRAATLSQRWWPWVNKLLMAMSARVDLEIGVQKAVQGFLASARNNFSSHDYDETYKQYNDRFTRRVLTTYKSAIR